MLLKWSQACWVSWKNNMHVAKIKAVLFWASSEVLKLSLVVMKRRLGEELVKMYELQAKWKWLPVTYKRLSKFLVLPSVIGIWKVWLLRYLDTTICWVLFFSVSLHTHTHTHTYVVVLVTKSWQTLMRPHGL